MRIPVHCLHIIVLTAVSILFSSIKIKAQDNTEIPKDSMLNDATSYNGFFVGGAYNSYGVADLGVGRSILRSMKYLNRTSRHPDRQYMPGQVVVGAEIIFKPGQTLFAPKAAVTMGISFVHFSYCTFLYYSDFSEGAWSYRPDIAFSWWYGRLYYAYNIPISNKNFLRDLRHQVGVCWFMKTGSVSCKRKP